MIRTIPMQRTWYFSILFLAVATVAHADDLRDWYCPYSTDGSCAPKRQTYGYFAPKWRRWPGVSNADYQSKRPPQEPAPPPAATDSQGLPPTELLLPPTEFRRDEAPAPPGGPGQAQPLTPETTPRPDILSPPEEDVMEELLPGVVQPKNPAKPAQGPATQPPSTPRQSEPADDGAIPFPEAEIPANAAPAPKGAEPSLPTPGLPDANEPAQPKSAPSTLPATSDPFEDDPFFKDNAPAPSESRQPLRLDRQPEFPSRTVPATHDALARLPAASLERVPQSRLSRNANSGQPTPARPGRDFSQAAPRMNPLRPAPSLEDHQVMPAASWQAESNIARPDSHHPNTLR